MNRVSGTYQISVTYCQPTVKVPGRENTIQMLLHGVAYTKSYWSGIDYRSPDFPNEYSWVATARSQGYATLAIDNLGNGKSEHPDPINVVQPPLQIEIMRQIIHGLRKRSLPQISKSYKKVVFATHSYGSILGRALATLYPTDGADAYVLTAASGNLTGIMAAVGVFQGRSANVVDSLRFGSLPSGYLAASAKGIRDAVYSYDSEFDAGVLAFDQTSPHNFVAGELAGDAPNGLNPSKFTGPVFVLTGRYDQIACGVGNFTAKQAYCGAGKASNPYMYTKPLFPKASKFDVYVADHTGHDITLHYSAQENFGVVHEWLESVGF
ncbi:hypothetical protein DL98DRAFT_436573 [Cadophora sp. DSE1049]|nr:hypothetical protein DL98DRAFT_436573 [Cadophora sp. DSE1049]